MAFRRLQNLGLLAVLLALPEAAVRSPDQQLAFQAMLVGQLLGVIVAAIAIAAAFSALGLAVVRRATLPLQREPSTFVAWAFLRAPRTALPLPLRAWRALLQQAGAADADPPNGRLKTAAAGLLLLLAGGAWAFGQAGERDTLGLALRNLGAAAALHGLLLVIAGLPRVAVRRFVLAVLAVGSLAAAGLAGRDPRILPVIDPLAVILALLGGGAATLGWLGQGAGAGLRAARRGQRLAWLAAALLVGGLAARGLVGPAGWAVALLSAGAAAVMAAAYALLQHQSKVTLPVFVSIVGVAAGTWALIVVLSVMGGFAADLRSKMLVANAHALVETPGRASAFGRAAALSQALRQLPGVLAVSPQVRGDAILSSSFNVHNFVGIRGIDTQLPEVAREIGATLRSGSLGLLGNPVAMASDRGLQRRPANVPADVPAMPEAATQESARPSAAIPSAASQSSDDAVLRAMGSLPPGPAEAAAPQPADRAKAKEKLPDMLLLPSDGKAVGVDSGRRPPQPPPAEDAEVIEPSAAPAAAGQKLPPLPRAAGSNGVGGLFAAFDDPPAAPSDAIDAPVAPGLLVGVELARTLQVELGDKVEVVTPDGDIGPTGLRPRVRTFRIAGTFETGLYEADSKVAYMTMDEAARYFNLEGQANVLELRLQQPEEPDAAVAAIQRAIIAAKPQLPAGSPALQVIDWRQLNRSLFSALAFERLVIFLVLGLIILVAAFSIVSALTMVILQKHDSIAMLRAMGAHVGSVRAAFVQMGGVIGVIGTAAGLVLGLGTCTLVELLGIQLPEAYYVRTLPVRLHAGEIAAVVAASLAISLLATVFPARAAAKLEPLQGLRHG